MGSLKNRLWGLLLVNLATFTWATNITAGRWLREDIGPVSLTAARFIIAGCLFAVILRGCPPPDRRLKGDFWLLLGMALSGVIGFSCLLYLGLHFTTAVNANLIQGAGPLITALLAALLIKEKIGAWQVVGALLGLSGVAGLISGLSVSFFSQLKSNMGDLVVLVAVLMWSLYSILSRQTSRRRSAVSTTAWPIFIAVPLLIILALLLETPSRLVSMSWSSLAGVFYIGVVPSLFGVWAWNKGISILGAAGAMFFYNTLPLYGVLLGAVLLGEQITGAHLICGGLIIVGGLLGALRVR